ncbi:MAG: hypothetical protein KDA52_10740, partial [Planctomycetaceae bacterium]|nr:hypothetical protein [Planctomycetaceae bacterium]
SAQVLANAQQAATDVAAENRAGDVHSVYTDSARDVRLGQYTWNSGTQSWDKLWGVSPYNMVEVTLHRDQAGSALGDRPLDLFFAPVLGTDQATVSVSSTAVMQPGSSFSTTGSGGGGGNTDDGECPCGNPQILPLALDLQTWTNLMNGIGSDNYSYNESTGAVTNGSDGILECSLYPYGNQSLPPGNRGTVDLGSNNNSTADISRQILYGLNADDMSYFNGEITFDENGELELNGDTGLSAGIKDELEAIKGDPRAIPIFSAVSGPGNNANYTIVKFVGIRIMYVKLTGKPADKKVIIQPAPFVDNCVIPGDLPVTQDSIFAPSSIIN